MAQKTFKYPLVITGDYESIVPQLLELGYSFHPSSPCYDDYLFNNTLVTNLDGNLGTLSRLNHAVSIGSYNRTEVSASNPELVLALAAAVEEERGQKGEYYVNFGGMGGFTKGNLYQLKTTSFSDAFAFINDRGRPNGWSGGNYEDFRKATKEEILNYFDLGSPKSSISFEEAAEAAGAHEVDFSKLTPPPAVPQISVPIDFIKSLHDQVDEDVQEQIEEKFPNIFSPRPTFRAGDKIVLFPSCQELMIIGGKNERPEEEPTEIALVDLADGLIKSEPVFVNNLTRITERELIEAGEHYGVTRRNYAKFL